MRIGYARVSTNEQNLDPQIAALKAAGCEQIFTDQGISGATFDRPGLHKALAALNKSDTIVVWKLDRLGRSIFDLVRTINEFSEQGVEFCSLTECIDTNSPGGRLLFHMMAALAEFERSLISERTRAGMRAAKAKGQHVGRPPLLNESQKLEVVQAVHGQHEPIDAVAERYGVHPRTIRRIVSEKCSLSAAM